MNKEIIVGVDLGKIVEEMFEIGDFPGKIVAKDTKEMIEGDDFFLDIAEHLPTFLPPGWKKIYPTNNSPVPYVGPKGLRLMVGLMRKADGEVWMHISVFHRDRLPTYKELCLVKQIFVGADREAIQIFSQAAKHANLHPYCLRLWSCLSNLERLPAFS